MELYERTIQGLKDVWSDEDMRQNAKVVLFKAISSSTELPAKEVDAVFSELDRLLITEESIALVKQDSAR